MAGTASENSAIIADGKHAPSVSMRRQLGIRPQRMTEPVVALYDSQTLQRFCGIDLAVESVPAP